VCLSLSLSSKPSFKKKIGQSYFSKLRHLRGISLNVSLSSACCCIGGHLTM